MEFKENVLDRIEQSFSFLTQNFVKLILPLLAFYVGVYYVFYVVGILLLAFIDTKTIISPMNYNIAIGEGILFLTYLILEIAVILGIYKTIKDIDEKNDFTLIGNYIYGFRNIFESFKTYYHIFMYIYFIPAMIFIIGGMYFIYLESNGFFQIGKDQLYGYIGWGILAFFLFVFYFMYRSNKTVFALVSAVTNNTYNKENFKEAVTLTHGKWWRVFGNFFLVGLIIGLLSSLIGGILSGGPSSGIMEEVMKNKSNFDLNSFITNVSVNLFSVTTLLTGVLSRVIVVLTLLFIFIFTYIFYKRLQVESTVQTSEIAQVDIV